MSERVYEQAFAGGELTPEFWGHIGDAKYQSGLAKCLNFLPLPHGPVTNRAGFAFVRATKGSGAGRSRLIPFTYSTTQTMVIEMGEGYFWFHTMGATLLLAGNPYEVANPYTQAELFDIHYVQSADVLTLVHPNHAPLELRRLGATNWTLTPITFVSSQPEPTAISAVATVATGSGFTQQDYVVTAVGGGDTRTQESAASNTVSCSNNLLTTGNYNTITWNAAASAATYNIYKNNNSIYGFIGQTTALTFDDANILADLGKTPPIQNDPFSGAGNLPGAVSYFEQRRVFAGTINKPQNFWMTRSGTESDMSYSFPTVDDDSIIFRVAAREANTIRHIVPLTSMLLLTSSAEWRITSVNTDAITPSSVSVKPQSFIGANNTQPVIINNNVLFVASRGGHMREMAYSWQANGYTTGDLSLRAPHLFNGYDMVDMCYSKAPYPICWSVSTSGKLIALTYVPEQQIGAWSQHDTQGVFESCCCVAEGNEDVLYVIVKRYINNQWVRFVEQMQTRAFTTQAASFFVDAGLVYSGTPAATISGLNHLENMMVSILGDGAVFPQQRVVGGAITLDQAVSYAVIGLRITADLQTLPMAAQIDAAFAQGKTKNVNAAYLRVYRSGGIFVGPTLDTLVEAKQRTTEPYNTPPALISDEIKVVVKPSWGSGAQLYIRQIDPLPLTLISLALDVTIGS